MRLAFGQRGDFTRLCAVMLRGEELALRTAERQVALASHRGLKRQLVAQLRHEQFHVATFQGVLELLPRGRSVSNDPALQLLEAYEHKLVSALGRGDLEESLLGLQVILEGAAAAVLRQLDLSVQSGTAPLHPARCLLVAQEDGHQVLGEKALASMLEDDDTIERLRSAAQDYAQIACEVLAACGDTLGTFGIAAGAYDPLATLPVPLAAISACPERR